MVYEDKIKKIKEIGIKEKWSCPWELAALGGVSPRAAPGLVRPPQVALKPATVRLPPAGCRLEAGNAASQRPSGEPGRRRRPSGSTVASPPGPGRRLGPRPLLPRRAGTPEAGSAWGRAERGCPARNCPGPGRARRPRPGLSGPVGAACSAPRLRPRRGLPPGAGTRSRAAGPRPGRLRTSLALRPQKSGLGAMGAAAPAPGETPAALGRSAARPGPLRARARSAPAPRGGPAPCGAAESAR